MTPRTRASDPTGLVRPLPAHLTRTIATSLVAGLTATTLTGCLISYDAAPASIRYVNHYADGVVVIVETLDPEITTSLPAGRVIDDPLRECADAAIRVETESGEVLGRVDEEACPDWVLTINEDGTLDYREK